jgi:hypothetical protein
MASLMTKKYPLVPPHPQRMWFHPDDYDYDDDDVNREWMLRKKREQEKYYPQRAVDVDEEADAAWAARYEQTAAVAASVGRADQRHRGNQDVPESPKEKIDEPLPVNDRDFDSGDNKKKGVWSYGAYLLREKELLDRGVDADLRMLVARCLCDQPQDRPRLHWLKMKIEKHIRRRDDHGYYANEADDAIGQWMEEMKW